MQDTNRWDSSVDIVTWLGPE